MSSSLLTLRGEKSSLVSAHASVSAVTGAAAGVASSRGHLTAACRAPPAHRDHYGYDPTVSAQ